MNLDPLLESRKNVLLSTSLPLQLPSKRKRKKSPSV